jgi:2-polyprenyl-3-methyl-5-hydroxy-6-metoxy-1,4-benzoquinol methylase
MSSTSYVGTELDAFAHASNWKQYLRHVTRPYLKGHVLEVGGGIGTTTSAFRSSAQTSWTALEPDLELALRLSRRVSQLLDRVHIVIGTLDAIRPEPLFDCVIYIDVLEHVQNDAEELRRAAARLVPGGTIVVLSPAHQALYTRFDEAIGHYRRYDRRSLSALTPAGTTLVDMRYLDSAGLWLSLGNRVLLRSPSPTVSQVKLWDRWCIPLSRRIDHLLGNRLGKSILAVWRRGAA